MLTYSMISRGGLENSTLALLVKPPIMRLVTTLIEKYIFSKAQMLALATHRSTALRHACGALRKARGNHNKPIRVC